MKHHKNSEEKKFVTTQDKKDWEAFIRKIPDINEKDEDLLHENKRTSSFKKLDLHGYSLVGANQKVKEFITESFNNGIRKILVVTGKGSRSIVNENPYISEKLSVLKYSIPDFIKNDENLSDKIIKISPADTKDGGEGAIYIFLKSNKKVRE